MLFFLRSVTLLGDYYKWCQRNFAIRNVDMKLELFMQDDKASCYEILPSEVESDVPWSLVLTNLCAAFEIIHRECWSLWLCCVDGLGLHAGLLLIM